MRTEFDHIEQVIDEIAEIYGVDVADEILSTNSIKLLSRYTEMMGIDAEIVQDLIDDVNLKGW